MIELLLNVPVSLPSVAGIPSLEPIPGSAAPTPPATSERNTPELEPKPSRGGVQAQEAQVSGKEVGDGVSVSARTGLRSPSLSLETCALASQPHAGPSRSPWSRSRNSSLSQLPLPGSYFPSSYSPSRSPNPTSSPSPPSVYRSFPTTPSGAPSPSAAASASGSKHVEAPFVTPFQTPSSERPRPSLLEMPAGTPDDPVFSSYPSTAPLTPTDKGKSRAAQTHRGVYLHFKPSFRLGSPPRTRRPSHEGVHRAHGASSMGSSGSASPVDPPKGRRRAATVAHPPTSPMLSVFAAGFDPDKSKEKSQSRVDLSDAAGAAGQEEKHSPAKRNRLLSLPSALKRRRASFGSSPFGKDFAHGSSSDTDGQWPDMPGEEAKRMDPHRGVPFAYDQSGASSYALQSVSTLATVRPLASPGVISARRSSLTANVVGLGLMSPGSPAAAVLGLPMASTASLLRSDDGVPPTPPPRRSSLSFGPDVVIDIKPLPPTPGLSASPTGTQAHEATSILSASLTTTEGSSGESFSPLPSAQHPLSSATTSLSRSAKSGREKDSSEGEHSESKAASASLNALRLQRSLEWEAKQGRHRRRLEKRKMILLELAETEVTYAEDLRLLVQVYLPQLAALPSVTQKMAGVIGRNATELLSVHSAISVKMVDVLREEALGFRSAVDEELEGKVERVSRRVAALLVEYASSLSAYNTFCAGSIAAASLVRNVSLRTDYDAFERRCQIICASFSAVRLMDLLDEDPEHPSTPGTNKSRLHFRDYLIMPIQRVCRYPLLLGSLLGSVDTPASPPPRGVDDADLLFRRDSAPHEQGTGAGDADGHRGEYDVGVDVERALGAMRGVAEEADEARRRTEAELKSKAIASRIEPHPAVTPAFLGTLGSCRLIGSLDVLHHHPTLAPLVPPVRVKYLAAFLYRGYLVLAKVKKAKTYEVRHFLPLEVFELIDITEGFLPHSIRLSLREHNFDLAASCAAEKEVWAAALVAARDESTVPPFELPASVSPFAAKARRVSIVGAPASHDALPSLGTVATASKRHTLAAYPDPAPSELPDPLEYEDTPTPVSPTRAGSVNASVDDYESEHDKRSTPRSPVSTLALTGSTLLLRRATGAQRLIVDRGLLDVFSESCAQARSKSQLHQALFLPDPGPNASEMRDRLSMRDSTMLRRRRSFLDARHRQGSIDIAFTGEVKGSVMDRPKSHVGNKRHSAQAHTYSHHPHSRAQSRRTSVSYSNSVMGESATEMEGADDTATSDFGTLRGREYGNGPGTASRTPSVVSASPAHATGTGHPTRSMARRSLSLFRPSFDVFGSGGGGGSSSRYVAETAGGTALPTPTPAPPRVVAPSKSQRLVRKTASVMNFKDSRAKPVVLRAKSTPVSPVLRPQGQAAGANGVKRASSDPDPKHLHLLAQDSRELSEGKEEGGLASSEDLPEGYFASLPPPRLVPVHSVSGELSNGGARADAEAPTGENAPIRTTPPRRSTAPVSAPVHAPDSESGGPIYMLGNGLTNTPERTRWTGSIRRGVGKLKRGNSAANLSDMALGTAHAAASTTSLLSAFSGLDPAPAHNGVITGASTGADSGAGAGADKENNVPPPVPPKDGLLPLRRNTSSSGFLGALYGSGHVSASTSTGSVADDEDDEARGGSAARVEMDTTPRRRRSVKLLQSFRGFTPM